MPKGYTHTLESVLDNTAWIPFCGCRLWLGALKPDGYGRTKHLNKNQSTHRLVKMLELGRSLGPKECVLHKCDTPSCINPAHLFIGTQKDNVLDMHTKGRGNPLLGEAHQFAKCTTADVIRIRTLRASGLSLKEVAAAVSATRGIVEGVLYGKSWTHVK